ncbi:MAG: hypothetical protein EA399_17180 [Desulfovibrionales bacterium]|nr:MAG: hypothetical protein EA399_17180 [Desulfovibrionales bacterium]
MMLESDSSCLQVIKNGNNNCNEMQKWIKNEKTFSPAHITSFFIEQKTATLNLPKTHGDT